MQTYDNRIFLGTNGSSDTGNNIFTVKTVIWAPWGAKPVITFHPWIFGIKILKKRRSIPHNKKNYF
jgi:hypothetical protein